MAKLNRKCVKNGCHSFCKTCSLCDNENACTSCHRNDFKVSENPNDKIFKCTNTCDVLSWHYKDGYKYCKPVKIDPVTTPLSYPNTKATAKKMILPANEAQLTSIAGLLIICVILFFIIILLIICKRKRNDQRRRKATYYRRPEIVISKTNQPAAQFLALNNVAEDQSAAQLSPLNNVAGNDNKHFKMPSIENPTIKPYSSLEEININEFEKIKLIGGGVYSEVYKGILRENPAAIKVAVKKGRKSMHKEIKIYAKISHQHIVPALGIHLGVENILFLTLRKYDLKKYFDLYGSKLGFYQLKQYSIQVANGMMYLHSKNILHCDLKIDNILVKDDKGDQIEISDFGCAIDLTYDRDAKYNGTQTHTSYELLKNLLNTNYAAKPTKASDVWSYAITAWQIFQKNHEIPNDFWFAKDIVTNYEHGKKLATPAIASEKFWHYIFYQCFDLDPEARPTMEDLYNSLMSFKEDSTVAPLLKV